MIGCSQGCNTPVRARFLRDFLRTTLAGTLLLTCASFASAAGPASGSSQELEIEITKKGLGKEVTIRRGTQEWFMLVEVTPENTVVVRQEKNNEAYVVDESETHDRAMTAGEVDAAINDFINSVKTQAKKK